MPATSRLKIGLSACFSHADPTRSLFSGKTLQYVEQSIAHWLMSSGAMVVMVPCPTGSTQRGDVTYAHYAQWLDGLVLHGGADVWPGSYGETPLEDRWSGDKVRDEYDKALVAAFEALGKPVFGPEAPALRVNGRKVSNGWANLETLWMGVGDSLYGFRVYPIAPLIKVMRGNRFMRRFDFDPEAVVRLCWAGVRPVNIDAPVRYLSTEEGGVSHFKYLRDNTLLTWMHTRLFIGFVLRLPLLIWRRLSSAGG